MQSFEYYLQVFHSEVLLISSVQNVCVLFCIIKVMHNRLKYMQVINIHLCFTSLPCSREQNRSLIHVFFHSVAVRTCIFKITSEFTLLWPCYSGPALLLSLKWIQREGRKAQRKRIRSNTQLMTSFTYNAQDLLDLQPATSHWQKLIK